MEDGHLPIQREKCGLGRCPQVYEVIKPPASRIGREASVAELMTEAWKGSLLARHTIAVTIAEARKALAEYGDWIVYRPSRGYLLIIPAADGQVKIGWLTAQRSTREGLEKALERFHIAAGDQFDRRPFDAIARACLMSGVYSVISPSESMARFEHAYKQAADSFCLTSAFEGRSCPCRPNV